MKSLSKLAAAGVMVLAFVALSLSPVFADSPPQLGGGPDVYVVKNLTKGGNYANIINADACDELKYSIRLHNTSFGSFQNVKVSVSLPSNSSTLNTSTMTATTNLGGTTGAEGTAKVNLSSAQTVSYENGSAVLNDVNGNAIRTLSDTITTSGVDIGSLNGSTTEFVQFKAKVNCPTPPVTPPVTPPTTPPATPAKPTALPNTGAGDVIGLFAGASAAGTAAHMVVTRRNRK